MLSDKDLVAALMSQHQSTPPFVLMEQAAERVMQLSALLDFWKTRAKDMAERVRQNALMPETDKVR